MPRLIRVFAGRSCHFVGFVMRRLIYTYRSEMCRQCVASETDGFSSHRPSETHYKLPSQSENGENVCAGAFDKVSELKLIEEFENGEKLEMKCISGLLPGMFARNAHDYPNTTAVYFYGRETTYYNLNKMASQIARYLKRTFSQECLKTRPIILFMEKSETVIAVILGIWKAGGYFLPISLMSKSTLKETIKQTDATVVITNARTEIDDVGLTDNTTVTDVTDMLREEVDNIEESLAEIDENDTAYVIKTSGSTGKPKQCRVSHKSLSVLASAWLTKYRLDGFPVNILQWAQLSFDVFVGDLVRGLVCAPGKLCLCPDALRLDIPYVLDLIKAQRITMAEMTPQFGKLLVECARNDELASLRILVLGSDVLQSQVYTQIKSSLHSAVRVINSYGMTEATIDSACFEGDPLPETRSDTVPIGKPLPGVKLYILDTITLKRCPIGAVGELYISGPVIATGDVEVTKIDKEISALKTGDAACWLPSGDIELLGRLDNMLKIRGYRISTSEIENAILAHVHEAKNALVTTAASKPGGDNELLCAYIVPKDPESAIALTETSVRRYLQNKLPSYMIPDFVYTIINIPLTTNGKIDRNALTRVAKSSTESNGLRIHVTIQADQLSQTCITLLSLFKEALSVDSMHTVQPDVSFMEQGGNSLVIVRLSSLIQDRTPYQVRIDDIYSHPTIMSLATFIDERRRFLSAS